MVTNRIDDYPMVNDMMKEVLGKRFYRTKKGDKFYVFESFFPSQEGTYLNFRGKDVDKIIPISKKYKIKIQIRDLVLEKPISLS